MRRISVLSLVCAVLMAVPAASGAQGVPSDPKADSPSGVVYEIPAERGRKDAAPRGEARQPGQETTDGGSSGGGSSGGGSSGGDSAGSTAVGGTSETSIRSDNNFGTSSDVPGADRRGARPARADRAGQRATTRAAAPSRTSPAKAGRCSSRHKHRRPVRRGRVPAPGDSAGCRRGDRHHRRPALTRAIADRRRAQRSRWVAGLGREEAEQD